MSRFHIGEPLNLVKFFYFERINLDLNMISMHRPYINNVKKERKEQKWGDDYVILVGLPVINTGLY